MQNKKAGGNRAGLARRLVTATAITGLAAGVVALGGFMGEAHGSTSGTMKLSASSSAAAVAHCPTTNLRITFGKPAKTKVAHQDQVRITLLNSGHSTCSMSGYPGMDMVGENGKLRLSVPREAESHTTINLRPNHYTSFTLTYVLGTGKAGDWGPDHVVITAPNSVSHQTVKWTLGRVSKSSVKPGGGTYLSPVGR